MLFVTMDHFCLPDIPHHNVDKGVLNQTEEHEKRAGGHKHVNGLKIQRRLSETVVMINNNS